MPSMKNFAFLSCLLVFCVLSSCNKSDWRDAHIGSYNTKKTYEFPSINLSTGQVSGYITDVDSFTNPAFIGIKNIQILKNDYADKYTVKLEGKYIMDVDKDGFCTLPNGHFTFIHDTLHLSLDNLNDTSRWGRYTYIGVKN
jgi:hypothetical protein